MEFGLFNSACVLPQFRGDEHRRIMDEVAIVQAADRVGLQVHLGDGAPLPHGVLPSLGQRGVPRIPRGRDLAHPPRLGDLQRHSAGEPPGPRRRAGRDARSPLRRAVRVRHGPRIVDHRATGLRYRRSGPHPRHVRRGRGRVRQDVAVRRIRGFPRPVLLDAAAQRAAEAVLRAAPADVGRRRQPGDLREGRAHGPRRAVFHDRRPGVDQATRRDLQERRSRTRSPSASS